MHYDFMLTLSSESAQPMERLPKSVVHIYMDTPFISYLVQHPIASVNLQSK